MQPRNTVADFNKLAAEAKGSTLLRIMHDGQGMPWLYGHRLAANSGKSAVRAPCRGDDDFCIETYRVFMSKEKLS